MSFRPQGQRRLGHTAYWIGEFYGMAIHNSSSFVNSLALKASKYIMPGKRGVVLAGLFRMPNSQSTATAPALTCSLERVERPAIETVICRRQFRIPCSFREASRSSGWQLSAQFLIKS